MSKDLILPGGIIGSKKNKKKGSPLIEGVDVEEVRYSEFKAYNDNINIHHENIDTLVMRDNYVLIRLFKFEEDTKTEGGIIVDDVQTYKTEGGQIRARTKTVPYQKRGVIVMKGLNLGNSEFEKLLVPGTIVHVPSNELRPYHLDRTKRVADISLGYFAVHVATLDAIESV